MQRIFDILFASIAILVLVPLLIPIVIILRLTGEGEIFYIQQRVGKNNKMFGLIKFATMLKNSPNIGMGTITVKNDPRVLPFGKFLRKTKINELPQILNIFFGDMSFIGPRPQDKRCFMAFPITTQQFIVQVKPGLSGIGSIIFRDEESILDNSEIDRSKFYDDVIMPYKGKLEEWYVKNQNLYTYFILIVLTVWVIIYSKSKLYKKVFTNLPPVPDELAKIL